jgi:hypothetical protein
MEKLQSALQKKHHQLMWPGQQCPHPPRHGWISGSLAVGSLKAEGHSSSGGGGATAGGDAAVGPAGSIKYMSSTWHETKGAAR